MSALGQKRTFHKTIANVRFTPESGHRITWRSANRSIAAISNNLAIGEPIYRGNNDFACG